MNTKAQNTNEYIAQFPQWKEQLTTAQEVIENTVLKETIKWGAPCYTYKGKNLIGLAGFKNHCAIWFHKGSLLKDKANILINAQPGKTQLLRQLRFKKDELVDKKLLKEYILEAIELEKLPQQKAVKQKPEKLIIDKFLVEKLETNQQLKKQFNSLSLSCQREYSEYITEAKRESTKQRRLEKIIPMIMGLKGLHDKYKK